MPLAFSGGQLCPLMGRDLLEKAALAQQTLRALVLHPAAAVKGRVPAQSFHNQQRLFYIL